MMTSAKPFASLWPSEGIKTQEIHATGGHDRLTKPFRKLWESSDLPVTNLAVQLVEKTSATDRALATYELLENILSFLSWNQLFPLQRVSKSWKSVIRSSLPLREKMFISSSDLPLQPVPNVLWFGSSIGRITYDCPNLEVNPATSIQGAQYPSLLREPLAVWLVQDLGKFLQYSVALAGTAEDDSAMGSWSNMHITRPPLAAVNLDFLPSDNYHGYNMSVYNPKGVTFGDIYDWTWKLTKKHEAAVGRKASGRLAEVTFWLVHPNPKREVEETW